MVNKAIVCFVLCYACSGFCSVALRSPSLSGWPMFHADPHIVATQIHLRPYKPDAVEIQHWRTSRLPNREMAVVYVGSYDHKVYAFNAQTGGILWVVGNWRHNNL